jgi:hypothetical protein
MLNPSHEGESGTGAPFGFTLLRPSPSLPGQGRGQPYTGESVTFDSLDDLHEQLRQRDLSDIIVRAALRPGITTVSSASGRFDPGDFHDEPRAWAAINLHLQVSICANPWDGAEVGPFLRAHLPDEFQEARCIVQEVSYDGKPHPSWRLWFLLSRAVLGRHLAPWVGHPDVDTAPLRPVEPIRMAHTSRTKTLAPQPQQLWLLPGRREHVNLPASLGVQPRYWNGWPDESRKTFIAWLAEMGEGKDRLGFRPAIISAIAAYARDHGSEPLLADRDLIKSCIRLAIADAFTAPGWDAELEPYRADDHLDAVIRWLADGEEWHRKVLGYGSVDRALEACMFERSGKR